MPKRNPPAPPEAYRKPMPDVVDPRWLLKVGGLMIGLGLLCAYIAVCTLFYKAQWQLVLHPSRMEAHTPAEYGLQAEQISLSSGLHGWWIAGDRPGDPVVLMLPSGDGSASDSLQRAATFHDAHLSVVLFDYRGYGDSSGNHPTQAMMQADSEAAFQFLPGHNGVSAGQVLVYGKGVGASLATRLCVEHPQITALLLEAASGDLAAVAVDDPRARIVPFHLLFHENFPLAAPLATLKTPKLLLVYPGGMDLHEAGDPKMTVNLASPADEKNFREALQRFLDSYITQPASTLTPKAN